MEDAITAAIEDTSSTATEDARRFGELDRAGGWGLALLVARSVFLDEGDDADAVPGRVSVERFAEIAGIAADRVMGHYLGWQEAAEAGAVPPAEELRPGQSVEFPPAEWWAGFHRLAVDVPEQAGHQEGEIRREPVTEAPVVEEPVHRPVAEEPPASGRDVLDRVTQDPELRADLAREVAATPELRTAVTAETARNNRVEFLQAIADSETWRVGKTHEVPLPAPVRAAAAEQLALADAPDATPEIVNAAFKTVRGLLNETIEADPAIHAHQQRQKLRRAIKTATARVESLPAAAVGPVIDEELLAEIRLLVHKLSAVVEG